MFSVVPSMKRLVSKVACRKAIYTAAAAAALALPVFSHADPVGRYRPDGRSNGGEWRHDDDRRHDDKPRFDLDIHIGQSRPEYRTREVRVWVPPVYRTVTDHRWVEPVYRTEVERVWVPERCEDREVHYRDHGRDCVRVERVVVEPGHYESRERRVCVSEGRWEDCERQELVCEGHYEIRSERVRVGDRMSPVAVVNPGLIGIGGITHAGR